MRTITHLAKPDSIAPTIAVLLPCAYGTPEDFEREGFISAVSERALEIDIVLADMNLEQITNGTALTLLRDTIITDALQAGYTNIILMGISIGGFMAISYAVHYPEEIDNIYLIAPYLGNRMITDEIISAGGILRWSSTNNSEDDHERRAWQWLKTEANHTTKVHLGYGNSDRFAAAHKMLADLLASDQVEVLHGGHEWSTWRNIWDRFLDRGITHQHR